MKDFYLLEKFWKERITGRAPARSCILRFTLGCVSIPLIGHSKILSLRFGSPELLCAPACISFQGLRRPHLLLFRGSATPRIRDGRAWTDALPTRCPVKFFHSLASPYVLVLRARAPWQAFRRSSLCAFLLGLRSQHMMLWAVSLSGCFTLRR